MIKHLLKPLGIAALFSLSVGSANAITLSADEIICEGPTSLLVGLADCSPANSFGDGPTPGPGPTIDLLFASSGEAVILGGVRGRDSDEFADTFVLSGSGKYKLTLDLINTFADRSPFETAFDATWTQGGTEIGELDTADGITSLMAKINLGVGGTSAFSLNAAGGDFANNSIGQYKLTVTAVPVPAGGLLLLSGLGGLALARRRRAKA